jgi:ankyrin repeat protein
MIPSLLLVGLLFSQATPARAQAAAAADLLEAARLGELARARELVAKVAAVDAVDRRGLTPLMWASAGGHTELVRQLLESGAVTGRRAADGTTALMLASGNGFTEVARALILKGADVAAARGGVTARQLALERGYSDVVTLIDQADVLGRRLLQAASEGHDMVVRQVLALGAPVNMSDAQGATALMIAARNGDLGILQALLSRGADASAQDTQGRTALQWAEPSPSTGKYVAAFLRDQGVSTQSARSVAPVQSPQVRASLATLTTVLARIPPASAPVRTELRRANAALSQLRALSDKWPADSPDDYRDNLAEYLAALEAAVKAGDAGNLAATLEAVADDLEIKLEHCLKSGGRLGGSVVVRVRTLQGSTESRSWQVFYMPKVFEAASNASPNLFPQLSSPTNETLVPGRYVMWVRDPATARLGERTVVKVGDGRTELLLDLPVPASSPR